MNLKTERLGIDKGSVSREINCEMAQTCLTSCLFFSVNESMSSSSSSTLPCSSVFSLSVVIYFVSSYKTKQLKGIKRPWNFVIIKKHNKQNNASLLRTIFASLARGNERVYVLNERNFPQAKLDSEINVPVSFKRAWRPTFLSHNNSVHIILFNSFKRIKNSYCADIAESVQKSVTLECK